MKRWSVLFFLLGSILMAGCSTAQLTPTHPSQQPVLEVGAHFPRCRPADLAAAGFPDHLHAQWWPDWRVLTDEQGQTYGPGAFCDHKTLVPRPGLVVEPGRNSFGHFITRQNQAYKPCDMVPLLETLDWAGHLLPQLTGLALSDTLTVVSPDNVAEYRTRTGQDVWRLYQLDGNQAIIEPYGTLQARTLDGHAVFMLVTDWLLRRNLPVDLPVWLHAGLLHYLGENGAHLVNYMAEFRAQGPILFSPPLVDFILGGAPDPDRNKDREMYRRASYSAFLMVWELVENRGGIKALREFLVLVDQGVDPDQASRKVYGLDLEELAKSLDPVVLGEPLGGQFQSRRPSQQP